MAAGEDIILYIVAIFLPPLVVLAKRGCGGSFCLNILLTLLGWIPGVIHAWLVVAAHPRRRVVYRRTAYAPPPAHYHRKTYVTRPAPRRRYY